MASSPKISDEYLWTMLTTDQVESIRCKIFIAASPHEAELPKNINSEAMALLKQLNGRIFSIALRGKSQGGKSTMLNRLAMLSNRTLDSNNKLAVATRFGCSTTHGIWMCIITFKNKDALLLFDMQGTDRGADEITYKLIAFTDHICSKVVDVFRMPEEGFSNEYVNILYCLLMGRESVKNLSPTSDKAILWTNCELPMQSPNNDSCCETPEAYQHAVLNGIVGERAIQAEQARKYANNTPILKTDKPPREVLFRISELENTDPFIQNHMIPVMKQILKSVQPIKLGSHVINGGDSYVEYLNNIYNSIQKSDIDFPFCAKPMIVSIALALLKEKKDSIKTQIDQIIKLKSDDLKWISNHSINELNQQKTHCLKKFEELIDFPRSIWEDQYNELNTFIQNHIKQFVDEYKRPVMNDFINSNYPLLSKTCRYGYKLKQLKVKLNEKLQGIMQSIKTIPFFNENIDELTTDHIQSKLQTHLNNLCTCQQNTEQHLSDAVLNFKKSIYSSEPDGVDAVINNMINECNEYGKQQFALHNVIPKVISDIQKMTIDLKNDHAIRSKAFAEECQKKCISKYHEKIGNIITMNIDVPQKYGILQKELENCLRWYYDELPWPLNDETFDSMDAKIREIYNQALDQLYTPEVRAQLKRDRAAQMELLSNSKFTENESYVWVHCVHCGRIFAGRTKGCVKVQCSHFVLPHTKTTNTDHGCGETFIWELAQPVRVNDLPEEMWLSNIEEGRRDKSTQDFLSKIRQTLQSASRTFSGSKRVRRISS